ncbi:receptor kinase-like protein Xa21 [Prosopis cineraria]|uniref:receptor kinase-like protein Xa21 n=1 Tax=Prosopis cineraria TaxID=364024 RepID=UPI00240F13FE|nr:receptor kinase-like protein Xa21 [Prosopis cineraria]
MEKSPSFAFLMFSLHCFISSLALIDTNITTDKSTLLGLKSFITSDPYDSLSTWCISSSPCNWVGVTCNTRHGRVHSLNLGGMDLKGTISKLLGNLSFLVELDLSSNNFYGEIPRELVQLRRLKQLNLSFNDFHGKVPAWIGDLSTLEHLNLQNNDWNFNLIEGIIPIEVGRLERLKVLRLAGNKLSGIIPQMISNLSSLELLSLSSNTLSGGIPNEIGHLPQLQIIYLGNNQLSGSIPTSLLNSSMRRQIDLGINQLSGSITTNVCLGLPKLELFSVDRNDLSGEIPSIWHQCKELAMLQLGDNMFNLGIIPSDIGNLTNLQRLYLPYSNLQGFIPMEMGNLDKLNVLALPFNYFKGRIPFNIFNISTLTRLHLDQNSLSGLLPSYLGIGLPNLKELQLAGNELTGQIPNSISNSSNLILLDLSLNKFSGVIPIVFGNLTKLMTLSLHGNYLNGLIPDIVSKLHSLQFLSLSNNRLQGSIIDELCQLKSLSELYLANNMFLGVVPGCFGNTSLRKLNFSYNNLISHIPSSLWSLKDILVLDISSNELSGTISLEVSNLRTITLLNLSRNNISGSIPTTMGSLQTLQTLSLSQNKLQGNIPKSLGGMISMVTLDLSHNYLSGVIPKSLELLAYLQHIILSYNLLQGEIPNGGPFQNFTAESFMMNNDLCGKSQLQVHPCRKEHKHMSNKVKLLIKCLLPIICMVAILVFSSIVFLKCKRDHVHDSTKRGLINFETPPRISYYELWQGTNGFDESNLLGSGSFGLVYKATLPNTKMVAVKVFKLEVEEALRSFDIECAVMCNLRHRNLIKTTSCCSNDHFKSLIMEYMANGSLDKWLYSHNYCLDVLQRLNIMIDVAFALEYLHHSSSILVVHCDVKPSNVLLDEDMVAHLSDFGIARLFGEGQWEIYTKTLATIGYVAPEYGSKGLVSVKGDVYSYGILLMEMFTRKKPTDEMFVEGLSLKHWVSKSTPHSITNILDANLLHREHQNIDNILPHISSVFELALNCCHDLPEARLSMADVVVSLKKIKVIFVKNVRGASS